LYLLVPQTLLLWLFFEMGSEVFALASLDCHPLTSAFCLAGIIGVYHQAQLFFG
jgi:hypothetical protein